MKSLSPIFLTQNASAIQWSLGLLTLDLIVGGFFANQGYWELTDSTAVRMCNVLSIYLYLCVIYRIIRPKGHEHAQIMMLLLIMPRTDIALAFLLQQSLVTVIVMQTFLNRFQIYSLMLIGFTILPSAKYLTALPTPLAKIASTLCDPTATTKTGFEISTIDQLYHLYRFNRCDLPPTYRLFRILPVCRGLNLVKKIDELTWENSVQVRHCDDGKYRIEGLDNTPEAEKAISKVPEES